MRDHVRCEIEFTFEPVEIGLGSTGIEPNALPGQREKARTGIRGRDNQFAVRVTTVSGRITGSLTQAFRAHRLLDTAFYLDQVRALRQQPLERRLVLAGSEVAFEDQHCGLLGTCWLRKACPARHGARSEMRQHFSRECEQDGEAGIAQPARMRSIARPEDVQQRFLDRVLGQQWGVQTARQFPRQRRLATGGQARYCNERETRHRLISEVMKPDKRTVRFTGRIITLTVDEVTLPNGHRVELEVVHHPGGAAAVAIDTEQRVCMLRQYRYVAGGWIWELPAGKLEPNEPPLVTAQRELIEEAGMQASQWQSLGSYFSSPGIFTEVLHLFLATGLQPAKTAHEHAEVIEVHWIPFAEAYQWAVDGRLVDGKTAMGLIRAQHVEAVRAALAAKDAG